jgi:predicted DNA-binding transcriptional regulator YafY
MDRHERITALHRTLKAARYPVTVVRLMDELGCSRATVYRDLAYLRDALLAPIVGDGEAGFRYDPNEHDRFELPGLWLSSEELYALLAAQQLLSRSTGGVMAQALAPMQQRIEQLLAQHAGGDKALPMQRMRIIAHRRRRVDEPVFRTVVGALMERKRLAFDYRARSNDVQTRRQASPQRLTHYRDNWYLDAWDHDREALRSFSLDRIAAPRRLDDEAHDVPEAELDHHLADGYGIFSGEAKGWATIVFSAKATRWVADERWHSRQQGRLLPDGRYELKLPYSAARELLMDVLHYGADAEITAPPVLREQARTLLALALANYER